MSEAEESQEVVVKALPCPSLVIRLKLNSPTQTLEDRGQEASEAGNSRLQNIPRSSPPFTLPLCNVTLSLSQQEVESESPPIESGLPCNSFHSVQWKGQGASSKPRPPVTLRPSLLL